MLEEVKDLQIPVYTACRSLKDNLGKRSNQRGKRLLGKEVEGVEHSG